MSGTGIPDLYAADRFDEIDKIAVNGFLPVLAKIPRLLKLRAKWRTWLAEPGPKILVLIDYPGFNLKLLRDAQKHGVKVVYVAPPQVWIWKPQRIKKLQKVICACLFDYEHRYLQEQGINSFWVGHPLADQFRSGLLPQMQRVGQTCLLLPGSRIGRFAQQLPYFQRAFKVLREQFRGLDAVVVLAPELDRARAQQLCQKHGLPFVFEENINLSSAKLALMMPGTATLKYALMGIPVIACAQLSPWSAFIARRLAAKVYFSLPSKLIGQKMIPELILPADRDLREAWQYFLGNTEQWQTQVEHLRAVALQMPVFDQSIAQLLAQTLKMSPAPRDLSA